MNKRAQILVLGSTILLIVLSLAIFSLLFLKQTTRPSSQKIQSGTPLDAGPLSKGIQRYLDFQRKHGGAIVRATLEYQLHGTITSVGVNSLTLKSGSDEFILTNEDQTKQTSYVVNAKDRNRQPRQITKDDLRVGDEISIIAVIDPTTASLGIKLVTKDE